MKTNPLAISLLLTFTTGALFAKSPVENVILKNKNMDTIPSRKDTIPKSDTVRPKDNTFRWSGHANGNLTANKFPNFASRDTVPSPKDSIPKKDSTLGLSNNANANLTAYNFASRDTVPSPKDTIPKKDSTANLSSNVNLHSALAGISKQSSKLENPIKNDEPVYTALLALEIYKPM